MAQGTRTNFQQLLLHLARQAAYRTIVEPFRDVALLRFLQTLDGPLLLLQIAFVFDFGFHGFEFVADGGKQSVVGRWSLVVGRNLAIHKLLWHESVVSSKELWCKVAQDRDEVVDGDLWTLQKLCQGLTEG